MSGQIQTQSVDVVVIGAGPAGAHAAGSMARAGLEVALVDRKAKGKACIAANIDGTDRVHLDGNAERHVAGSIRAGRSGA